MIREPIPEAVLRRWRLAVAASPMSSGVKLVGLTVADLIGPLGGEAPFLCADIASACGLTHHGVRKAIVQLCDAGFLRKRKAGFGDPNQITICGRLFGIESRDNTPAPRTVKPSLIHRIEAVERRLQEFERGAL